jgi:hypothetical protein
VRIVKLADDRRCVSGWEDQQTVFDEIIWSNREDQIIRTGASLRTLQEQLSAEPVAG